ncbi:MAG: hypothetical protein DWQ02_03500 [Bacteroidetes bacterium]|nr:MAG: hypothetical protein DWQ02_03500 [Bacteroidota bacterium]
MFQFDKTYQGWSWERVSRHVIYWVSWMLFYAISNSTYHDYSLISWIGLELLIMCIKLPFVYFVLYFLMPKFFYPRKYLRFFSVFLITATIAAIGIWALYYYVFNPFYFYQDSGPFWSVKINFKLLDLIYIVSIPIVLKMHQRQSLQEKQTRQLAEEKLGAELKLLKNQLHPHFLFNTLNNLYSMVLLQHPKASDVVLRLSEMMSYMLYECERPRIDLQKEIDNIRNYIELEMIRYGKRLDISLETGGEVTDKTIAPLLLLPFLENAFKHGVEKSELNSWVRVNLWVEKSQLTFMVENSLPENGNDNSNPKIQSGVGLANVKKRLQLLYPDNHQLEIKNKETFLVKLNINLDYEMPNS